MKIFKRSPKLNVKNQRTTNSCHWAFSNTVQNNYETVQCTRVLLHFVILIPSNHMSLSRILPNSTSTSVFTYLKISHTSKPEVFSGPAKNLHGPVPVRGPAVENHCVTQQRKGRNVRSGKGMQNATAVRWLVKSTSICTFAYAEVAQKYEFQRSGHKQGKSKMSTAEQFEGDNVTSWLDTGCCFAPALE